MIEMTRDGHARVALTLTAVLGFAAVAMSIRKRNTDGDRPDALAAYLRDHLAGSDAALTVVERLQFSHGDSADGDLYAHLRHEFIEERAVVRQMLEHIGASPWSAKRAASLAGGGVTQLAAGGAPGSLSLFRTVEGLTVAVQGKRLLWRLAQSLAPTLDVPGAPPFAALEAQALDQWERLDARRQALAPLTFGASTRRATEPRQRAKRAP